MSMPDTSGWAESPVRHRNKTDIRNVFLITAHLECKFTKRFKIHVFPFFSKKFRKREVENGLMNRSISYLLV